MNGPRTQTDKELVAKALAISTPYSAHELMEVCDILETVTHPLVAGVVNLAIELGHLPTTVAHWLVQGATREASSAASNKLLDGAQQGAPACPHCQADHKTQFDATTMGDLTAGQRCFLCNNCGKEYHWPKANPQPQPQQYDMDSIRAAQALAEDRIKAILHGLITKTDTKLDRINAETAEGGKKIRRVVLALGV